MLFFVFEFLQNRYVVPHIKTTQASSVLLFDNMTIGTVVQILLDF